MDSMYGQLEELLKTIRKTNSLHWTIKIYEKKEAFTPLGLDLAALEPMFFAAGAAEFIYSYASFLADKPGDLYKSNVFRKFERTILPKIGTAEMLWARMPVRVAGTYREDFEVLFRERRGGYWSIASSDILRIELEELWKENPGGRRGKAHGKAGTVGLLPLLLGAHLLISPPKPSTPLELRKPSVECITSKENVYFFEEQYRTMAAEIGREGHTSDKNKLLLDENAKNLVDAMKAASVACRAEGEKGNEGGNNINVTIHFDKDDIPLTGIAITYFLWPGKKKKKGE